MIACPEEIAFTNGFIDRIQLSEQAARFPAGNEYGDYLRQMLKD